MKAFLRYYVELPHPLRKVDDVLARLPGDWLESAAREANIRGQLMLHPGAQTGPRLQAGQLVVLFSPTEADAGVLRHHMQWFAHGQDGEGSVLILRGDLELAELGPARTQLALNAQYDPFISCAEPEERMEARRVGESTLKAFVDRLASYVEAALRDASSRRSPLRPRVAS